MAKYRVLFICLFGLLCFKTLTLGQQYAPDPSLEEIKNMDAQEGLPRDTVHCKDPTPAHGQIKVISGNPYHLYCKVDVMCDAGYQFSDGTTSINVTCLPFPHPCMCMAGWQTDIIPDLTCNKTNFIPKKDKDNTIDSFDDKGPYDKPDVIDTRGVSNRLIDDKSTKDKWDKDLKKRNIVNKFDAKVKSVLVDSEEFPTEEETSLSAEEETGESKSENTIPETDPSKGYSLNSEYKINIENKIDTEESELNTEQQLKNEETDFQPQTLKNKTDETEENTETSLEHSDYETKIDTQPVLELNEDSVQNNVEIFDPKEEEFEILPEENETQIEEEESENYIVENNEVGVIEPEIAEEEIQAETEENETRTDDEEQDNGITEYIQVGELQPGIEEEETQTEITEEEEYPEYDVVGNNENEDIEYEMDEEEIETETEDNTSKADTNEMANQIEEPVSRLENEEIYDKEAVSDTKGLDTNVDVPQFMTDFHLQQKDPEMGVNSFPVEKMDPACHRPPVTGFCRAAFRRFYFNSETGECHTFIFGGCGGNENNFETMEECMKTCSNVRV